jgi:hypothetical protein
MTIFPLAFEVTYSLLRLRSIVPGWRSGNNRGTRTKRVRGDGGTSGAENDVTLQGFVAEQPGKTRIPLRVEEGRGVCHEDYEENSGQDGKLLTIESRL